MLLDSAADAVAARFYHMTIRRARTPLDCRWRILTRPLLNPLVFNTIDGAEFQPVGGSLEQHALAARPFDNLTGRPGD